jgi:hypothetical protein
MPWTFAHPAAVLPLRSLCRDRLSFGALIVGSMTPDLGYYFGCFAIATTAHTLWGLATVCLPSGLALLAIIRILHRPVADILPFRYRHRLLSLPLLPRISTPTAFCYASIALLIGALTHNAWDSFTHKTGYSVLRWPILQSALFSLGGRTFRLYEVLQHVSTVLGTIILFWAYRQWGGRRYPRGDAQTNLDDRSRYRLLTMIAAASLVIGSPTAYFTSRASLGGMNIALFVVRLAICCTTAFLVLLCAASIVLARRTSASLPDS